MGEIVAFVKEEQKQWSNGQAFCIACNHTWIQVCETGITNFDCPSCKRMTGHFKFEFKPTVNQLVLICGACKNTLFYLTPEGHMCANCGIYQKY